MSDDNVTREPRLLAMRLFEQLPDDFTSGQRRGIIRVMSELCDLWEKWRLKQRRKPTRASRVWLRQAPLCI